MQNLSISCRFSPYFHDLLGVLSLETSGFMNIAKLYDKINIGKGDVQFEVELEL